MKTVVGLLILLTLFSLPALAQVVEIPDPNLRAKIESALGKASGATITTADMETLTQLYPSNVSISSLTGLEHATNLTSLDLQTTGISDISALSGLTNLESLGLEGNSIFDVSSLSGLTNLESLGLSDNNISDISSLSGLTNLRYLQLDENSISDISPVSGLTNLWTLHLYDNSISDISPVSGLTNLTQLLLGDNNISDISSLSGLTNLYELGLNNTGISDLSVVSGLTNLTQLHLYDNNISNISSLSGLTNLYWLNLSNNNISDLSALVSNTGLGSGDTVNVRGNPLNAVSINTHIPTLQRRGVTVRFDPPPVTSPGVNIPDRNLRAAVESALGKASGAAITVADMETLTILDALNASISNLTGLEHAINLTGFDLSDNAIVDVSPLSGLTNLTGWVDLSGNAIVDVSPLSGLTNLTGLGLIGNRIADVGPLSGLTNLTGLFLGDNSIVNVSPLSGLTNLTELGLSGNAIADVSPLSGLTNLTWLGLGGDTILLTNAYFGVGGNNISDISALVSNTGLGSGDEVDVRGNPLNAVSINTHIPTLQGRGVTVQFDPPLVNIPGVNIPDANLRAAVEAALGKASGATITTAEMATLTDLRAPESNIRDLTGLETATRLEVLWLSDNNISDISALSGLTRLVSLFIRDNNISDISVLVGLTNLAALGLEGNNISNISALRDLTNLQVLRLSDNSISNISALRGLTNLQELILWNNAISDISALSRLTNLEVLYLRDNSISNISSLSGLTNLQELILWNNAISDISALSRLANLEVLGLDDNNISNITALSGLINLQELYLSGNSISNITALSGLTNLELLSLWNNAISDISALSRLTNLQKLYLNGNSISDISPLVTNTGLGSGDEVDVRENPLNRGSINTHIPALQQRGVTVWFDDDVVEIVEIPDANLRAAVEKALGKASGATITTADMATLTELVASAANISDLTGLETATYLKTLSLWRNRIVDISSLSGLTKLELLYLHENNISDLTALSELTNLALLYLSGNQIVDISALSGLTHLNGLYLRNNQIVDISALAGLTHLGVAGGELSLSGNRIVDISSLSGLTHLADLYLGGNQITDLSALSGLTNLELLYLSDNQIVDISSLSGLTRLNGLYLDSNTISELTALSGLTNLAELSLSDNQIVDISSLSGLTHLGWLDLFGNEINDISPLVANTGLGEGDRITLDANPLNYASINTHIPALQQRGVEVSFSNLKPLLEEFALSIPAGTSLIHVPLKVTAVDGAEQSIESISDLYDALGGASTVNFLVTHDSITQEWRSYFSSADSGSSADIALAADTGIIVNMKTPVSVQLTGESLGTDGSSTVTLHQGLNLVGLPLNDSDIMRVSGLFALDGIRGNVAAIIHAEEGEFKTVGRAGDPGDVELVGGQGFIMIAQQPATVTISGEAWTNVSDEVMAAPALRGIEVRGTTPVLGLRGAVVTEQTGLKGQGFRVTVKNLSTQGAAAVVTAPDEEEYRLTVVDIETGHAATIGDTLEISAQSPHPFIGVEPMRYTVTAADVRQSLIQLPELVAYEIPAETQLLANYPNPFNPETWIPYRLAEDAFVTLTIYDTSGQVVRTLDVGHRIAAVYESRSKAIYWDGRNALGEGVASGVYFYHLSANDYSATRRLVILK